MHLSLPPTDVLPACFPVVLPPQVFCSGTDELLELFKAVYELHGELGDDYLGLELQVCAPSAAAVAAAGRLHFWPSQLGAECGS